MSEGGSRRAVAEIRFGEDRSSITKVAGRSIHQFWSLLSPHFRDVLLAPQRRSDDGGVAWTWREGVEKKPLTAAELAGVRKRLERANDSFAENPVNPLMGDDRSGTSSQALVDQVAARVKAMADSLSAKSDAALADFVCRTETGIMIHSWGVVSPAPVIYPESMETGLSGVVLAGEKRLEGYEVIVENAQGLSVARTRSELSGEFHFTKIGPGRYRVRVVSGRVKFPAKGVMVTVERGAVARLEMRSAADSTAEDEPKENETGGASGEEKPPSNDSTPPHQRGGRGWISKATVVIILLLLLGGGVWAWRTWWSTDDDSDQRAMVRSSTMAPEDFSAGDSRARTVNSAGLTAGEGAGLGASADGVAGSAHRPVMQPVVLTDRSVNVAAKGSARSPSTIGSRVDVQSGVADSSGTITPNSNAPSGVSEVKNSDASGEAGPAQMDLVLENGDLKKQEAALRKSNPAAGAGSAVAGTELKGGGNQAAALESGSTDNSKRPPGGIGPEGAVAFTNQKKKAKVQALGALPTRTQPSPKAEAPGGGAISGSPASDGSPEALTVNLPNGEKAQSAGPISKVLVVNHGPVTGKPSSGNETQTGETRGEGDKDPSVAPKTPTKKTGPKKPDPGVKAAEVGNAEAKSPSATAEVQDDDALAPPPPAETNQQPEASSPSNGETGGEPAADPVNGASVPASTAARAAVAGEAKAPPATVRSPVAHPGAGAANKGKLPSDKGEPTEQEQDVNSGSPGRGLKMASFEMAAVRWDVRLVRDAIVPTMPVRVGEVDLSGRVREKLISERKGRVPEMFKNPAINVGFVFALPKLPDGGAYYWRDAKDAVKKSSDGNQAEISWAGNAIPFGSVFVLVFPNGQEAVRLTVQESGSLSLVLAEEVRGSLRLGVARVASDESGPASEKRVSRFGWQVNGVARKTGELTPVDRNHTIDFPLEKARAARLDVALTDRLTGWALVAPIQLRPGKSDGAGSKEAKGLVR